MLSHPPSLSGVDVPGKPGLCEADTNLVARTTATRFHTILRACRLACDLGALAPLFVFMQALLSPKYHTLSEGPAITPPSLRCSAPSIY